METTNTLNSYVTALRDSFWLGETSELDEPFKKLVAACDRISEIEPLIDTNMRMLSRSALSSNKLTRGPRETATSTVKLLDRFIEQLEDIRRIFNKKIVFATAFKNRGSYYSSLGIPEIRQDELLLETRIEYEGSTEQHDNILEWMRAHTHKPQGKTEVAKSHQPRFAAYMQDIEKCNNFAGRRPVLEVLTEISKIKAMSKTLHHHGVARDFLLDDSLMRINRDMKETIQHYTKLKQMLVDRLATSAYTPLGNSRAR